MTFTTRVRTALTFMVFGLSTQVSADSEQDHARLRDSLKLMWDSIETLQFRSEVSDRDAQGRLAHNKGFTRYDFAYGTGGRRAVTQTSVRPDGEEILIDKREDGKRQYAVNANRADPKTIDTIQITNQGNTETSYSGVMPDPLYILMPFGKPLYKYIDEGAAVESGKGPDGEKLTVITFSDKANKKNEFRCYIDPNHDSIPSRLVIEGVCDLKVTRFERADGRWFPVEGGTTYFGEPGQRTAFRVTSVHFNRAIPSTTFNPMSLASAGTLIDDKTTGIGHVIGGPGALRKRFPATQASSKSGEPIAASVEPDSGRWRILIASIAAALLAAAVVIIFRRRARLG